MNLERRRRFDDVSAIDALLLRQQLGFGRYRKQAERDPEKRMILLELAYQQAVKCDRESYEKTGERRRRVRIDRGCETVTEE